MRGEEHYMESRLVALFVDPKNQSNEHLRDTSYDD
jgi:hypothetical protein